MWHAPNQRIRAAANAKKRERDKARKQIHIKRITAHLEISETETEKYSISEVRLLLNDLSPKGVGLYSSSAMTPGQEIQLVISEPKPMKIRCKVIWCQEHSVGSHILSKQPFGFRLGVEFILSPEEEEKMAAFCEEVSKTILISPRI